MRAAGSQPVERYAIEGPRLYDWLGAAVRSKHHRTAPGSMRCCARGSMLRTCRIGARPRNVRDDPALAVEIERPMFLLIRAGQARRLITAREAGGADGFGRWRWRRGMSAARRRRIELAAASVG